MVGAVEQAPAIAAARHGFVAGQLVGGYRIAAPIGAGSRGIVYAAERIADGHRIAVRALRDDFARPALVERWFDEVRRANAIGHPGLVRVIDVGYTPDGRPYQLMELLDGESLADRLAGDRRLGLAEALAIGRAIASALAAVHARGLVHRELRPDSIVLAGEQVKLVDLGMARLGGGLRPDGASYAAPEQRRGFGPVDARSDLYALGCVMHEMIAGLPAPPAVRALVASLMERAPAARPRSAALVVLELARLLDQLRAVDRAIDELATEAAPIAPACADETWKIRLGLAPDWAIVLGVMLCLGALVTAMVVTRWALS